MKYLAQLRYKKSLLKDAVISLQIMAVTRGGMWIKTNKLIRTNFNEKDIKFEPNQLIVGHRAQIKGQKDELSCAIQMLPDILESLSTLKKPADIFDAGIVLPSILETLSKSNEKAEVEVAGHEHRIKEWADSLELQRETLHKREVSLDDYMESLEDGRKKMASYANKIRANKLALNVELAKFRKDRIALALAMEHLKSEQKRLDAQQPQSETITLESIDLEQKRLEEN